MPMSRVRTGRSSSRPRGERRRRARNVDAEKVRRSVSETRAVCQCICATGERRWASGRRTPEAGGYAGRPSEGLRTSPNPVLREAPQPRRNSGLPVRLLRCLVVCPVVSAFALVTERLSP